MKADVITELVWLKDQHDSAAVFDCTGVRAYFVSCTAEAKLEIKRNFGGGEGHPWVGDGCGLASICARPFVGD